MIAFSGYFRQFLSSGAHITYTITVNSNAQRIRPLFHFKWFSQSFLDSILRDILIFQCSRPFRILFRLPSKLAPAIALQARFTTLWLIWNSEVFGTWVAPLAETFSYTNLGSSFILRISTKFHHQNLNQTASASRQHLNLNLNFKSLLKLASEFR